MTPRIPFAALIATSLMALVACGGADETSVTGPDTTAEATTDLASDPDTAEATPDLAEPAHDATEPAPEAVEEALADLPPVPFCQGTWDRPAWPTDTSTVFMRGPFLQDVAGDHATLVFRLRLPDAAPVRLLVFADAHYNPDIVPLIADLGVSAGGALAVGVGDSVSQPEEAQFDSLLHSLRALGHRVAWWPVLGNHEGRDQAYFDAFALPGGNPKEPHEAWYAARVGTVWFAALELQDITMAAGFGIDTPEVT